MATLSYAVPGLVLSSGSEFSAQVQDMQTDLRSLGYLKGPIDGVFGPGTQNGVKALQFDLVHNNGASSGNDGSAPVAIRNYNSGAISAQTGIVDQPLVTCIAAMLSDPAFPKVPFSLDPESDNARAIAAVRAMPAPPVPVTFLLAVLSQESGGQHFQVPTSANRDHYVTIGLDRNNAANPAAITSRGYGIGQYTLFHHPPTAAEVAGNIADPVQNVSRAISDLLEKFNKWVNGPVDSADDRKQEGGSGSLRPCQFSSADSRHMTDCGTCLRNAGASDIVSGITPFYQGSADTYARTQYHVGSYTAVPIRKNIPCDWPYAVRRYNGSGVNSYDYQAEVLRKALGLAAS